MITQFIFALLATLGTSFLFHVPKKCILPASFIGASGWVSYQLLMFLGLSYIPAVFLSTLLIALMSDICSRTIHDASTVFVIPGIIPLVPGSGMYYTMLYFITGDMESSGEWAIKTITIAGAIAIGLLVMASFIKIAVHIKRGTAK